MGGGGFEGDAVAGWTAGPSAAAVMHQRRADKADAARKSEERIRSSGACRARMLRHPQRTQQPSASSSRPCGSTARDATLLPLFSRQNVDLITNRNAQVSDFRSSIDRRSIDARLKDEVRGNAGPLVERQVREAGAGEVIATGFGPGAEAQQLD